MIRYRVGRVSKQEFKVHGSSLANSLGRSPFAFDRCPRYASSCVNRPTELYVSRHCPLKSSRPVMNVPYIIQKTRQAC